MHSGVQQIPHIDIPEGGSMPLCLTTSVSASATKKPQKSLVEAEQKHKKEIAEEMKMLQEEILALEPGSRQACSYFQELPKHLQDIFPVGKE
jgi:hypothetical protein